MLDNQYADFMSDSLYLCSFQGENLFLPILFEE